MKRLHEGLDYRLYKIYVWGGLAAVVAYILVATLVFDVPTRAERQGFLLLILPLILYLAGILAYWWWVFLFKGNRELEELRRLDREEVPGIQALRSWNTLHQAMAVSGGDVEELIQSAKDANRPLLIWYGATNLLAVWILGPIVLGSLGFIDPDWDATLWVWLAGVFVWIGVMLVGTPLLLRWGGRRAEEAYLAPLGLALARAPGLDVEPLGLLGGGQTLIPGGPAVVEGARHGRLVHIETLDKESLTVVQAKLPAFTARSDAGKLVPGEGAPDPVVKALRSLRKAKRWRGVAVGAGGEGITVRRTSRGTNMWLYDLWLAEHLLDRMGPGAGSRAGA